MSDARDTRARIVAFNDACPVCDGVTLTQAAMRVSRELQGNRGAWRLVSFRVHHACASIAVSTPAVELASALRQHVDELEQRHVNEVGPARATELRGFFLSSVSDAQLLHQEHS